MCIMKKSKLLKNKYLWILIGTFIVFPLLILSLPTIEDPFINITSQFGWSVNPDGVAPASVLQSLSITYPNTFSSCSFGDRISYTDNLGKKYFLDGNQRDLIPFYTNSLITTQTNRNLADFIIDTHGMCSITAGGTFNNVKAVADSGKLTIDVYYAKPDGSMVKIYSKATELSVKGVDLSSDKTLFSAKITASEIENKMTHQSDSYKSNIRIKPTLDLKIHYAGIDSTSWSLAGISETNLQVTVNNDKFQCLLACAFSSKEIKTEFTPNDNQVKPRTIMNFKVIFPGWSSDQGSPSYKIINAETGAELTSPSQIVLNKVGDNGVGSKSLLSPTNVGKYDIVITKQGRDTAIISFNVYKPTSTPPPVSGDKCDEGYVLIDGVCFLENQPHCTGSSCNLPPSIDPVNFLNNLNPEDYYGYAVLLIFILIIAVILKAVFKSSPQPRY